MSQHADTLREAIVNCDRDPIHIPGSVQDFGVLLACCDHFDTIEYISANAEAHLGRSANSMLGRPTSTFFSTTEQHTIRNLLGHETIERQREVAGQKTVGGVDFQMTVHRKGGSAIVELIPQHLSVAAQSQVMLKPQAYLTLPMGQHDLSGFWNSVVEHFRALIGFDRVNLYKFLTDGSGEVIAEKRDRRMPSFLGLRFPETDIPPIARSLYASTPIRIISDVMSDNVPLLAADGAPALDMSLAVLRGKDPVHRQFLENMGVKATMTVPIVVGGELWGLFAAHHHTPKTPEPVVLSAAELIGKLVSLRLQHALESQREATRHTCLSLAGRVFVSDDSAIASGVHWRDAEDEFARLLHADGIVFATTSQFLRSGETPDEPACRHILALADADDAEVTLHSDLPGVMPDVALGNTAGAMIIRAPGTVGLRLAYLRNKTTTSVHWAGMPDKDVVVEDGVPRLSPRQSFQRYIESVGNRAPDWSDQDVLIAKTLRQAFAQALQVQEELRDNRKRLGLMVRELNHRVRNILALVQSLSHYSRLDARSVEAYANSLEQRILALAGAHNLLTETGQTAIELRGLVAAELEPFSGMDRLHFGGPDLMLQGDAASIVALLLHELASNAAKYGAFSVDTGTISVTWQAERGGVELIWQEKGGPEVHPPAHAGFGMAIIREAIPHEFNGLAQTTFDPDGFKGAFWIPGSALGHLAEDDDAGALAEAVGQFSVGETPVDPGPMPAGKTALLVEDNFVIAAQTKRILLNMGFVGVDSAASVDDALDILAEHPCDLCVLDGTLQGQSSTEVAHELLRRGVPFLFLTGYGSDGIDAIFDRDVPVLTKPVHAAALQRAILSLLAET
ncbi:MAG: HWE histidine kinase domain-containing protein [Pseudomonadota bacterium]